MSVQDINEPRELTDAELGEVTGGLIWVHVARTAAVIVAGAVTVAREALLGELGPGLHK